MKRREQNRVAVLEAEVERLSKELAACRSASASGPARAPSGLMFRLVLVAMVAVLGLASALTLANTEYAAGELPGMSRYLQTVNNDYRLVAAAVVGGLALALYATRQWMPFTFFALVATYLVYLSFLQERAPEIPLTDEAYFWLSTAGLTLIFLLFSAACVHNARATGRSRLRIGVLATLNTTFYVVLAYRAIERFYAGYGWLALVFAAGMAGIFAVMAETSGPHRNYLTTTYLVKAVVLTTLGLFFWLAPLPFLLALGLEGLVLAVLLRLTGTVLLKPLAIGLLLVFTAAALLTPWPPQALAVAGVDLPIALPWYAGAAAALLSAAAVYERTAERGETGVWSGQWRFAGSSLDVTPHSMALWHAGAAAVCIAGAGVLQTPGPATLVAGACVLGACLVLAGMFLRVTAFEAGGALVVLGAHVIYHFFAHDAPATFGTPERHGAMAALLGAATLAAGLRWSTLVESETTDPLLERVSVAALPMAAIALLAFRSATVLLPEATAALALSALGTGLLLLGAAARVPEAQFGGLLAMGGGIAAYLPLAFYTGSPWTLAGGQGATLVLGAVVAERLLSASGATRRRYRVFHTAMRAMALGAAAALPVVMAAAWFSGLSVALWWSLTATLLLALGRWFRARLYLWLSGVLFAATGARLFLARFGGLSAPALYALAAAACVALAVVVWWTSGPWRPRSPNDTP